MTAIEWDKLGEKTFQTGVDRGVLYLQDGTVVPWNGLTNFEDNTTKDTLATYFDGVKYLEFNSPGDFSGKLHALTYPPEFDAVNGVVLISPGLRAYDQPSRSFCLSYRTKLGDDVGGIESGYLIHLLYNVLANPDNVSYQTLADSVTPEEFAWVLTGRPDDNTDSWRPTSHYSINSKEISSDALQAFEDVIYGTSGTDPRFPSVDELQSLLT